MVSLMCGHLFTGQLGRNNIFQRVNSKNVVTGDKIKTNVQQYCVNPVMCWKTFSSGHDPVILF